MPGLFIDDVDKMNGREFEEFCQKILMENGYKIIDTANSSCIITFTAVDAYY
jgi:HJR/Mrr/RecB family endonuclease